MTGGNSLKALSVWAMVVLLGVVLVCPCAAWAGDANLNKHLLAKWDFEGKGIIVPDRSGHGHDGQAAALGDPNLPPQRANGMVGKAMQFHKLGGNEIRVKNAASLNPTQALTIVAWVKKDYYIEGKWSEWQSEIVGKKTYNGTQGYRLYVTPSGVLRFEVGDGKNVYSLSPPEKRTIFPDTWYHLAATFSPGRMRLYINGRLKLDKEVDAQQIAPSSEDLVIGNYAGPKNMAPFNGLIDDVSILDVALESADILKLAMPPQPEAAEESEGEKTAP